MSEPSKDQDQGHNDVAALADVEQYTMWKGIKSLGYVFWVLGGMEMIERLAFYGVKAVAPDYADDPVSRGGLGVGGSAIGMVLAVWNFVQSLVPALSGGLSDRYGYKETIFASTITKIAGYLVMAFFPSYAGFMAGAIVLATGTAIFKPGIQGTLVLATNRKNSSLAWGVFYQTVNIGGWMGPLVAARFRRLAWRNVFLANAGIICVNFLLLLTYKEVAKDKRLERARLRKEGKLKQESLVVESLRELAKPHVWRYLLVFAGFWFMFYSLFEVLVLYIKHWVDTRAIVFALFGPHGTSSGFWKGIFGMNEYGTEIQAAGLLNLNAFSIMLTCFFFAQLSSKMRATTSIVVGCLFATTSMFIFSQTTYAWFVAGGILLFSVGEMLSSPKFNEYMGNFAPPDKKAMYLGFSQLPIAVGGTLEGLVGFNIYDKVAHRDKFARQYLTEHGMAADDVKKIKSGEAFYRTVLRENRELQPYAETIETTQKAINKLLDNKVEKDDPRVVALKKTLAKARKSMYEAGYPDKAWPLANKLAAKHNPSRVWYVMGIVGLLAAAGLAWYGRWVRKLTERQKAQTVEVEPSESAEPTKRKGDDDE